MSTDKHSPLPWSIHTRDKDHGEINPHTGLEYHPWYDGSDIGQWPEGVICSGEQAHANAVHAVHCVNLLPELVAALTEVAFDAQYPDRKIGAETQRRIEELLKKTRQ